MDTFDKAVFKFLVGAVIAYFIINVIYSVAMHYGNCGL